MFIPAMVFVLLGIFGLGVVIGGRWRKTPDEEARDIEAEAEHWAARAAEQAAALRRAAAEREQGGEG